MACKAETSPDLLKKLAHQRLDELLAQAERERSFGLVGVEVGLQNGWPQFVRKRVEATEKPTA